MRGAVKNRKIAIKNILLAGMILIFLGGFFLRYVGISERGLEYDEIWTMYYYASDSCHKIFTELATPNNHPLHSLFVKAAISVGGDAPFFLRLDALLSGIFLIGVVWYISRFLFNSRLAAFYSALFCACSGGLVHYSQTSRGYMLQSFLIASAAASLLLYKRKKTLAASLICCCSSIAAVLTLSTSILFIIPLFALFIFSGLDWRDITGFIRKNISILAAFSVTGMFCIFWYLFNWDQFQEGKRIFGNRPDSPLAWCNAVFLIVRDCGSFLVPLALLLLFHKKRRRFFYAFLFILIFPFACSPVTTLGPARSYLPLIPFCCIAAAGGAAVLQRKLKGRTAAGIAYCVALIVLAAVSGFFELKHWTPLDWAKAFPALISQTPLDTFIAYPSAETLPVAVNNEGAGADNSERIPARNKEYRLVNLIDESISGIRLKDNDNISIALPFSGKNIEYLPGLRGRVYRLVPLSLSASASGIVVMTLHIISSNKSALMIADLKSRPDWIAVNTFLTRKGLPYKALFVSARPGISRESMLSIEAANPGEIFFYSLEPFNEE